MLYFPNPLSQEMKRTEQMLLSDDAVVAIFLQFVTFRVIRSNQNNTDKNKFNVKKCPLPSKRLPLFDSTILHKGAL